VAPVEGCLARRATLPAHRGSSRRSIPLRRIRSRAAPDQPRRAVGRSRQAWAHDLLALIYGCHRGLTPPTPGRQGVTAAGMRAMLGTWVLAEITLRQYLETPSLFISQLCSRHLRLVHRGPKPPI
jgi:hypothetical protein